MIKKLRRKFILIAMTAIIVCTSILVVAINLVNYYRVDYEITRMVQSIAENDGQIPSRPDIPGGAGDFERETQPRPEERMIPDEAVSGEPNAGLPESEQEDDNDKSGSVGQSQDHQTESPGENSRTDISIENARPDSPAMPGNVFGGYRPEMAYETRFFVVHIDADGTKEAQLTRVATVSEEEALELASGILMKKKTTGYYNDYKYFQKDTQTGGKIVVIMDCETRLAAVRNLAVISIVTALCGIAAMFVFIAFFSKRAIKPVIESSEKQKQFITDASHELKTPLTVISANMDVLAMDLGDNEWVNGTQKQVSNLRRLVNNLVSLSRLEEENTPVIAETFDLSRAATEAAEPFAGMAEFEGKNFEFHVQQHVEMKGDESAIRQLTGIFCDNAVKYASEGGTIELTVKKQGKHAVLIVANSCEERVDEATLSRLFDRFYRGDASRNKDGGKSGYGIGLAIAKAIVEKQGGKVSASQEPDGKMAFKVIFA